jgi:DNA-binding NtrC family response regulator
MNQRPRVLLVDDTPANLDLLSRALEPEGYDVVVATSGEAAIRVAAKAQPDLVLLDVMMGDLDGFATCRQLKSIAALREVPVLFISARDQKESILEGFSAGGVDYITKPFDPDEIRIRVATHLKVSQLTRQLQRRNEELERAAQEIKRESSRRQQAEEALHTAGATLTLLGELDAERWGIPAFIGRSKTIARIVQDVRRLQMFTKVNVLIRGESGTGKELVARAIHFGGERGQGPFVPVNCVAIPAELAESMLFGHVRGAFTGATMDRKGYFELADGGTLFLDEIGDMPIALQAKLLRVLEDGCVTPVGATKAKRVHVRVVAATNADLRRQIASGAFRQDLYFRLAGFNVELPPLRQRREDVPLLAEHFLEVLAKEMGLPVPRLTPAARQALTQYDFPGNVREMKNVIERALIVAGDDEVDVGHLHLFGLDAGRPMSIPGTPQHHAPDGEPLPMNLEEAEGALIKRALQATGGNVAEAARRLGINRTRIYRRLGDRHVAHGEVE